MGAQNRIIIPRISGNRSSTWSWSSTTKIRRRESVWEEAKYWRNWTKKSFEIQSKAGVYFSGTMITVSNDTYFLPRSFSGLWNRYGDPSTRRTWSKVRLVNLTVDWPLISTWSKRICDFDAKKWKNFWSRTRYWWVSPHSPGECDESEGKCVVQSRSMKCPYRSDTTSIVERLLRTCCPITIPVCENWVIVRYNYNLLSISRVRNSVCHRAPFT